MASSRVGNTSDISTQIENRLQLKPNEELTNKTNLRRLLDQRFTIDDPRKFYEELNGIRPQLEELYKKSKISTDQMKLLLPSTTGCRSNVEQFDSPLIMQLLYNCCGYNSGNKVRTKQAEDILVCIPEINDKLQQSSLSISNQEFGVILGSSKTSPMNIRCIEKEVESIKKIKIVDSVSKEKIKSPNESIYYKFCPPTPNFIGREKEIKRIHQQLNEKQTAGVVISGLSGVGKSELARKYWSIYREFFQNSIIWINAQNSTTIESTFLDLFNHLGLELDCEPTDQASSKIFHHISKHKELLRKSLLVFDNLNNPEETHLFIIKAMQYTPYILITTQRRRWDVRFNVLDLGVFSEEEAFSFIRSNMETSETSDIHYLSHLLGQHPLAIQQAIAYINANNIAIKEYVELFQNTDKDLLTSTTCVTTTPVLRAMNLSTQSLDNIGDLTVKDLFHIMAFLDGKNIKKGFLLRFCDNNKATLDRSIAVLHNLSLINIDESNKDTKYLEQAVTVHTLIQKVVNVKLTTAIKEKYLERILGQIFMDIVFSTRTTDGFGESWFNHFLHILNNESTRRYLISRCCGHLETLAVLFHENGNLKIYLNILKYMKEQSLVVDNKVLIAVGRKLQQLGNHEEALEIFRQVEYTVAETMSQRTSGDYGSATNTLDCAYFLDILNEILEIKQNILNGDDPRLLTTLDDIASTLSCMGKYDEALELFRRIEKSRIKSLGLDHPKVLSIKHNIASIFNSTGQFEEAIKVFKNLEEATITLFGPVHADVFSIQRNIASIYNNMGRYETALQLFKELEKSRMETFGPDHLDVQLIQKDIASTVNNMVSYEESLGVSDRVEKLGHPRPLKRDSSPCKFGDECRPELDGGNEVTKHRDDLTKMAPSDGKILRSSDAHTKILRSSDAHTVTKHSDDLIHQSAHICEHGKDSNTSTLKYEEVPKEPVNGNDLIHMTIDLCKRSVSKLSSLQCNDSSKQQLLEEEDEVPSCNHQAQHATKHDDLTNSAFNDGTGSKSSSLQNECSKEVMEEEEVDGEVEGEDEVYPEVQHQDSSNDSSMEVEIETIQPRSIDVVQGYFQTKPKLFSTEDLSEEKQDLSEKEGDIPTTLQAGAELHIPFDSQRESGKIKIEKDKKDTRSYFKKMHMMKTAKEEMKLREEFKDQEVDEIKFEFISSKKRESKATNAINNSSITSPKAMNRQLEGVSQKDQNSQSIKAAGMKGEKMQQEFEGFTDDSGTKSKIEFQIKNLASSGDMESQCININRQLEEIEEDEVTSGQKNPSKRRKELKYGVEIPNPIINATSQCIETSRDFISTKALFRDETVASLSYQHEANGNMLMQCDNERKRRKNKKIAIKCYEKNKYNKKKIHKEEIFTDNVKSYDDTHQISSSNATASNPTMKTLQSISSVVEMKDKQFLKDQEIVNVTHKEKSIITRDYSKDSSSTNNKELKEHEFVQQGKMSANSTKEADIESNNLLTTSTISQGSFRCQSNVVQHFGMKLPLDQANKTRRRKQSSLDDNDEQIEHTSEKNNKEFENVKMSGKRKSLRDDINHSKGNEVTSIEIDVHKEVQENSSVILNKNRKVNSTQQIHQKQDGKESSKVGSNLLEINIDSESEAKELASINLTQIPYPSNDLKEIKTRANEEGELISSNIRQSVFLAPPQQNSSGNKQNIGMKQTSNNTQKEAELSNVEGTPNNKMVNIEGQKSGIVTSETQIFSDENFQGQGDKEKEVILASDDCVTSPGPILLEHNKSAKVSTSRKRSLGEITIVDDYEIDDGCTSSSTMDTSVVAQMGNEKWMERQPSSSKEDIIEIRHKKVKFSETIDILSPKVDTEQVKNPIDETGKLKEIKRKESNREAARKYQDKLRQQRKSSIGRIQKLEDDVKSLKEELSKAKSEKKEYENEVTKSVLTFVEKLKEMTKEIKGKKKENNTLESQNKELRNSNAKKDLELLKLREEISRLRLTRMEAVPFLRQPNLQKFASPLLGTPILFNLSPVRAPVTSKDK